MPLICCVSPKGGVGKTMIAANLAAGLAKNRNYDVIAVDLDPQNMLRLHLGGDVADGHGFVKSVGNIESWGGALKEDSNSGVITLPYGQLSSGKSIKKDSVIRQKPELLWKPLVRMAASPRMVVVVDTPPGPSVMLQAILPHVDLLLTVLAADAASAVLYSNIATGKIYSEVRNVRRGYVLNQFDPMTRLGRVICSGLSEKIGNSLFGIVHRDEYVGEALAMQQPVPDYAPLSRAAADLNDLSERVHRYLEALS